MALIERPPRVTSAALRLLIYDQTCRGNQGFLGLTHSWMVGAAACRSLGRFDRSRAVTGWEEALRWLAEVEPSRPIAEIQFWGHGQWGEALIGGEPLDERILAPSHRLHSMLRTIRGRLAGHEALWWFRCCEIFGADRGQGFAEAWCSFLGCCAAGHTFLIGPWQSGLHRLRPGETPRWSRREGLAEGDDPSSPRKALWSRPGRPHTITCFHTRVPARY